MAPPIRCPEDYFNDVHDRTPYHFKRHAIQNCLYGVDIDLGAVEIAKLRLWLSLVVDEEDVQQIKPLPNLDYKIVTGNSLFGVEKNLFNNEQFKQLEALKPKFFDESERTKKADYKRRIECLIHELTNGRDTFDFEIYFSEVFHSNRGFDICIANPPYGANIDSQLAVLVRLYPETTKEYKDIYKIFIELGLAKLTAKAGIPRDQQEPFVKLVKQITSIAEEGDYLEDSHLQEKAYALEGNIDRLVYRLYKVSPEEIKVVEANTKSTGRVKR